MSNGQGTSILDFGGFPGSNQASVTIASEINISNTSSVEAYVMCQAYGDKTSNDYRYFAALVSLSCDNPIENSGFVINGICMEKLQGSFLIHWVWTD
jgi:hypothetical protein